MRQRLPPAGAAFPLSSLILLLLVPLLPTLALSRPSTRSAFGAAEAARARSVLEAVSVSSETVENLLFDIIDAEASEPPEQPSVRSVLAVSESASALQRFADVAALALGVSERAGTVLNVDVADGAHGATRRAFDFWQTHELEETLVVVRGVENVDSSVDGPIHMLFMAMADDYGASKVIDGVGQEVSTGNTVILFLARVPGIDGMPAAVATQAATATVQARIDNGMGLTGDAFVGRLKFIVSVPTSFEFSNAAFELRFMGSNDGSTAHSGVAVSSALITFAGAAVLVGAVKMCSTSASTTKQGRSTRPSGANEASAGISSRRQSFADPPLHADTTPQRDVRGDNDGHDETDDAAALGTNANARGGGGRRGTDHARASPPSTREQDSFATDDGSDIEETLQALTVVELREQLRSFGLVRSGRKADLVRRLSAHVGQNGL